MDLDKKAPRAMAVLDPLKIRITNFDGETKYLDVPDFPADPNSKTHKVPLSSILYIEREDFNEVHSKDFYRLTPSQDVGLKYFGDGNISFRKAIKNSFGELVEIEAEIVPKQKVKSHIQWVSSPAKESPSFVTVNLYDELFTVEDLSTVPDFLDAINPDSLRVIKALVDPSVLSIEGSHVQFERLGFFYKDPDSTPSHLIWNSTVSLKQDKAKK